MYGTTELHKVGGGLYIEVSMTFTLEHHGQVLKLEILIPTNWIV